MRLTSGMVRELAMGCAISWNDHALNRRRHDPDGRVGDLDFSVINVHICGKAMEGKNSAELRWKMLHVERFCGTAIPRN
jgi:hypothetical protein